MKIIDKIKERLHRDESIAQWARRTGHAKAIEKQYNPTNPAPEDVEYLKNLHKDDGKAGKGNREEWHKDTVPPGYEKTNDDSGNSGNAGSGVPFDWGIAESTNENESERGE
ncbi:MAG: hypothetical protein M0Z50_09840 [Planctomycetia bacterium]|nr:hypothetical protein [Planctomycetia bacterium]